MAARTGIRCCCLLLRRRGRKGFGIRPAKALEVGAVNSYVIDAKEEFAREYALISMHTIQCMKASIRSYLHYPVR